MIEPQLTLPQGLEYNEAEHTYRLDGSTAPACSTVLKVIEPDMYLAVREEVMERARTRGTNGHAMIALDVRDQLDMASLTDQLAEHYLAWDAFRHDYGFECEYSERCVASRKYGYAGTLDLAGRLTKHKRLRGRWLVDVKFVAAEPKLVGPQTAGYSLAAEESIPGWEKDTPRGCLWIRGDKYQFIECPRVSDRAVFIAARTVLNWREMK